MFHIQAIHKKSMANGVKCRFSLNLQLFSVVLKSAPVKYIAAYCSPDSHQIHRSCTSLSLGGQNNPSLWLSWTVTIPNWVAILWRAACAPSDAKLLEGGACISNTIYFKYVFLCNILYLKSPYLYNITIKNRIRKNFRGAPPLNPPLLRDRLTEGKVWLTTEVRSVK